jgi:hypothetical protein
VGNLGSAHIFIGLKNTAAVLIGPTLPVLLTVLYMTVVTGTRKKYSRTLFSQGYGQYQSEHLSSMKHG